MPIKDILQRFQPIPLYVVLIISICYLTVQLVFSHITHALTLLMSSYHMLCNIFALAGCIITIKHSKKQLDSIDHHNSRGFGHNASSTTSSSSARCPDEVIVINMGDESQSLAKSQRREQKLRNTFGWARIDILTMLIVFIILASLSFSLIVEALQTLVHIDHQDTMHLPIPVMIIGFAGLVLNGLTYLLIGGYTLHQGSFLHLTPAGDVVLDRSLSNSGDLALKPVNRQLSKSRNDQQLKEELEAEIGNVYFVTKRQGAVEMLRDVSSIVFVIICAAVVYVAKDEQHTAKLIDPILSIFSCVLLVTLSYPYMKESCLILLQTIPGSIDMEIFERTLVKKFPEIISYHDLHIWQLAAHSYVATIHIKFQNPKLYSKIIEDVRNYFHNHGIGAVTIQPEFHSTQNLSLECLMQCSAPECVEKVCCKDSRTDLREEAAVVITSNDKQHTKECHEKHFKSCSDLSELSSNTGATNSLQKIVHSDSMPKELNVTQLMISNGAMGSLRILESQDELEENEPQQPEQLDQYKFQENEPQQPEQLDQYKLQENEQQQPEQLDQSKLEEDQSKQTARSTRPPEKQMLKHLKQRL